MKHLITISAILLLFLAGCKKEDLNSNKLKVEINNNDPYNSRDPYVIDVFNNRTGRNILSVRERRTGDYETQDVLPGDIIDITYTMFCDCDITIKFKGQKLDRRSSNFFGGVKDGRITVTIPR